MSGTNNINNNNYQEAACNAVVFFSPAYLASSPLLALFALVGFVWLLLQLVETGKVIHYNLRLVWEYTFIRIPDLVLEDLPSFSVNDDDDTTTTRTTSSNRVSPNPNNRVVALQDPTKPNLIQCFNPSTLEWLGEVPALTAVDVHALCVAAAAAQTEWRTTTFGQRRTVLRTIQRYVCRHVDELCQISALDSGKSMVDACLGEVLVTNEKIRTMCALGEQWLQPSHRPTGPMFLHKSARVEYVPLGIIAAIAPWNYPFHNYINHIISGIFAGNAVVGKVSEHTSWSTVVYFSKIVRAALVAHGHNPDLVQTVTGFGEAGAALVSDPLVNKVIFTGSPAIGKKVMETASHSLKPVILELGGKDAMVITEDCKLSEVIPWVMRGCFQNGGQNCIGVERVLVYESLHDEFVDQILARVRVLRQGNPLVAEMSNKTSSDKLGSCIDFGALVMDSQLQHIQELVDDAVRHGAKVLTGGKRNAQLIGQFYEPTVLTGVTPAMRIFQEEVFGPVVTVVKVPNDNDAVCVEMVNNSDFGLSASVFCGNPTRGLAIGRQIRSGMCCVNDFGCNYLVQSLPFGGVKDSGFGRFAGIEGLRSLCLERAILTDRIPGVKTSIPAPIDYPINNRKGLAFATSLIQLFYNESWIAKIKGIIGLVKYGS